MSAHRRARQRTARGNTTRAAAAAIVLTDTGRRVPGPDSSAPVRTAPIDEMPFTGATRMM
ncbi:hypothetical protein ACH5A7_06060 [Streptomyces sp. NPDC018955]|uniref:hypothetical protein n=1 Tax=Streptomyces sp. NPDC018955 TaxID=3365055 RepID=UPI0037A73F08